MHIVFKEEGIRKIRRYAEKDYIKGLNLQGNLNVLDIENKEYLTVLKIPKSLYYSKSDEFMFVKKHEIKYYGNLYDIIKLEEKSDTIYILCISDRNENLLEKAFLEHFFIDKQTNSKTRPIKNILDKLTLENYIFEEIKKIPEFQDESKIYPHVFAFPIENVLDIPVPPPKLFV